MNPEAGNVVLEALQGQFPSAQFRRDRYPGKGGAPDFPVQMRDARIVSSLAVSETLQRLPALSIDFVFVDRKHVKQASKWLQGNRAKIIKPPEGE